MQLVYQYSEIITIIKTMGACRQGRNLSDIWGGGGGHSYIRVMPDGFF